MIARGGPFPYHQDGGTFGNREGHLPSKPRGYYREYTVDTPGAGHRAARRIVTGGTPPEVWYYTDDHYDSFRSFDVGALDALAPQRGAREVRGLLELLRGRTGGQDHAGEDGTNAGENRGAHRWIARSA